MSSPLDASRPARRSLAEVVYEVVLAIPPGVVLTYGEVATEAGRPGAARAVGRVLASSDGDLPWWRVVASNGRLVPGHEAEHTRRLQLDGVELRNGRVPMHRRAGQRAIAAYEAVHGPISQQALDEADRLLDESGLP